MGLTYNQLRRAFEYAKERAVAREEAETTLEGYKKQRDMRDLFIFAYALNVLDWSKNDPAIKAKILDEIGWESKIEERAAKDLPSVKGVDW